MSIPLPADIQVTELADGVRYTPPRRRHGGFYALGIGLIAFGLFFSGVALFMTGFAVIRFNLAGGPGAWFAGLVLLFQVPFVLAGAAIITRGVCLLAGF